MKNLLKLQQRFSAGVTRGDQEIFNELRDNNPKFPPAERIESYRYAIASRLQDSLLEDFPLLTKSIGKESFTELLADYLSKYPSRTYNLSEVSLDLPEYFAKHPMVGHAYAEDLARFEVERLYSDNSEKNPTCLPIDGLEREDLSTIRLVFDSSVRPFSSEWGILNTPVIQQQTYVLLYENDFTIQSMEVDQEMFQTAKNLLSGLSLPQATSHLIEDQAPAVSAFFSDLVRLQLIIGYERMH